MGRVSGTAVNPMTAQGDTIVGGAGTPTGYGADAAIGAAATSNGTSGGWQDQTKVNDGNDATVWGGAFADAANGGPSRVILDLLTPKSIGKIRLLDGVGPFGSAGQYASEVIVKTSPDNVTYTQVLDWFRGGQDTTLAFSTIVARYWSFEGTAIQNPNDPPTHPRWAVFTLSLFPVTTVGAGNQTRLAAPGARRVMSYNPATALPEWQPLEAAIPKLADAIGVAGAIVDAGAAYSQANANNNTRTLSDKLDALITALQAHGILT